MLAAGPFPSSRPTYLGTQDGSSPLKRAALNGRVDVVRELLQAGADKNRQNKVNRIVRMQGTSRAGGVRSASRRVCGAPGCPAVGGAALLWWHVPGCGMHVLP